MHISGGFYEKFVSAFALLLRSDCTTDVEAMHVPAGICNLLRLSVITSSKDTVESLMSLQLMLVEGSLKAAYSSMQPF